MRTLPIENVNPSRIEGYNFSIIRDSAMFPSLFGGELKKLLSFSDIAFPTRFPLEVVLG
jgi:hypothetical protein